MPKKGSFRIEPTEEDSEQEGHPSDVLIVRKAVERKRKRDIELLDASEDETDAKAAAKKARKAAKRANQAAAASVPESASSPPLNVDHGNGEGGTDVSDIEAVTHATTASASTAAVAGKAANRAAKAKEAACLLSPDNAPRHDCKQSATANREATKIPAATGDSSETVAEAASPAEALHQAAGTPTQRPAFPAFRASAAASKSVVSSVGPPIESNLPGAATKQTRGGHNGSNSSGGIPLSVLMKQLQASPLQSPLPKLCSRRNDNGPGSDSALAEMGISPPPRISSAKRPGSASGGKGGVYSRLGSIPGRTVDGPAGVTIVDEEERPVVNAEMQRLLRAPRYFDDEFADSAIMCYRCGGSGHKAHDCTNEAKARPCALCAQFGHTKADCPSLVCFKCNRTGHISRDCPNGGDRAASDTSEVCLRCGFASCPGVKDYVRAGGGCTGKYSKADLTMVRCYVCCRPGHLCCQDAPTMSWRPTCHNCGEAGHVGSECTRPVPPAVRNERNPHHKPNSMAGRHYEDSYGSGGFGGGYSGGQGGACFSCGGFGHLARDCPTKQAWRGTGASSSGGCFTCGSTDHIARQCPQKAYVPINSGGNTRRAPYVSHSGGGNVWGGTNANWQSQRR